MDAQNHGQKEEQVYICPMHPEVRQDGPGICPECGMALVKAKSERGEAKQSGHEQHEGFNKHEGHSLAQFARKFWVSLILTVPVLWYSDLAKELLKITAPPFPGAQYLALGLGSIVFFYGGWVFLAGAWRELRARLPGMMTLIAVAISAAYLFSVFETLRGSPHTLFWELVTLITIMLLGHYLEMKAVQGAQGALKELSKLLPDTAEVVSGNSTKIIPLAELRVGDIVLVKPGGKVPSDAAVIKGKSEVNESIVTGESKPVDKAVGGQVIAGTINGDGSLQIRVNKIGESTFLAGVMRLVAEAQASKSRLQVLSDRAAFYLTIIAIATGTLTFVVWLLARAGVVFATERLVAVLVIACPHALGLAVPLVASISTTLAARNGLLVKQRMALEAARKLDMVLFDKTGTLTTGEFGVERVLPNLGPELGDRAQGVAKVLEYAASVDRGSEHYIARAIVKRAEESKLQLLEVSDFLRIPGLGAKAKIKDQMVYVGSEALLKDLGVVVPVNLLPEISHLAGLGKTIIYVVMENSLLGVIALSDLIREESRQAVKDLKTMGVKVAMLTGDSEEVALWVASELGIDEYFARVLPGAKSAKVKLLQAKGYKVAMVGDGVNDAPALTQADIGIAIGAGTNVAIESAGIILVKNDPRDIVKIIKLSRTTYRKMIQNLFWATGYNVVALPLAAGVLAFKGILLQPALAAVFMSLSTIIVAINALFLRRQKL